MVKIIKTEPDKSVVKQKVCKHCGMTLEYLPIDIKSIHGQDYSGGPDGCTYIVCPNCNAHVILSRW